MNPTPIIERHRKLVADHPENELARFSLGKAYFDMGEWTLALEQFEVALRKRSDWMVVQILAGKCALSLGNREEARAAFVRARELAVAQGHEGPLAELEALLAGL